MRRAVAPRLAEALCLDPLSRCWEDATRVVYALNEGGRWGDPMVYRGAEVVRAVPFDAVELALASLWG